MSKHLTTSEAAEILGLTPRRVRQLAADLGGVELVPGRLVFPRARIEAEAKKPRPKPGYPKGRPRKLTPPSLG